MWLVASIVAGSATAHAYPLNPWGAVTPARTVAYTQYVYVSPSGVPAAPYVSVGLGGDADLYAGASFAVSPDGQATFGSVELFPRWFAGGEVGLTPHLLWSPTAGQVALGPEVHWFHQAGAVAFTANAGWRPDWSYGVGEAGPGTVFAQLVPEVFVSDRFAVYTELHDFHGFVGNTDAPLVAPGVWFAVDAAKRHTVAVAPQFSLAAADLASAWSVGAWYSTTAGW